MKHMKHICQALLSFKSEKCLLSFWLYLEHETHLLGLQIDYLGG